jgi:hypothetical protein
MANTDDGPENLTRRYPRARERPIRTLLMTRKRHWEFIYVAEEELEKK